MESDKIQYQADNFDIAVVGIAGRFPGASNIYDFWQNLLESRESITFFTDEELDESGIDVETYSNPKYIKAGAIIEKPDYFDASFFKYSPREAEITDPQQRVFLECAWEAIENAGYDTERYQGLIGVYAGTSRNTYLLMSDLVDNFLSRDMTTIIGNDPNFLSTRVSYKLNLKGPSVTVQTACSTSLVAIHLACQGLLNQECDMAIAGGVSIRFPHKSGYIYQTGNIPSPDGHCRAFDEKAQGTVFGNGAGVVVLKRLADATHDGDSIYAVIKGSAINNDGHLKVDYTAPSVEGQSDVIVEALANAGVEADSISYLEAHGTGTALGDPIEIAALTKAYRNYTNKNGFCAVGSLKTNIGHLDVAAGVASFIKTVMSLRHRTIPANLHFQKPNPEIDFENSPFYVNHFLAEWKPGPNRRRAGVSSFGIGGTNAHVILEEAPEIEKSGKSRPQQLLLLSAKTETALEKATGNLADYLKQHQDINMADVAYTLQTGRQAFKHRRAVVCRDRDEAIATLENINTKQVVTSEQDPADRDVAFIFSGQGSQYVNMALELYETEPVFRDQVDLCCEILKPIMHFDLRDVIYPKGDNTEAAPDKLKQTFITQPALFTIEYALARLWMSWGINPSAMIGHSIGEYVAACLAGVFSLEDALKLVATRGSLLQSLPSGAMLAVFLKEEDVLPFLMDKLSLAVINGPSLCVVSGEHEAVDELEKRLSEKKINCRRLHTSHAFHSAMMEPVLEKFKEEVKKVKLHPPQIPFVANVTGTWITEDEAIDPEYWTRHLRHTVRFSDCLDELLKEPKRIILEVGPGSTFCTLAMQHPGKKAEHVILSSTRHPKDNTPDTAYILNSLGRLWLAGYNIDWSGFYTSERRHRLPLPTYPFERKRYWIASSKQSNRLAYKVSAVAENKEESNVLEQELEIPNHASKDNTRQILAGIWRDTLGIRNVNDNDNFFELGGNSLMAVSMFAEIESKLKRRLPLATLMGAPTFDQMAAVISDNAGSDSWSCLVNIQSGSSWPPLFLTHAAGGNLLIYRDLVKHLGPEQTVYGLQAQGLDGEKPYHTSIEDMAAQYVNDIQTVLPDGPYFLAGYCMGGSLALEMAQILRKQNKEIALVAMMETYNFSKAPRSFISRVRYRQQQVEFHLRNLLLAENKKAFFHEKAMVAWRRKDIVLGSILSKLGLNSHLRSRQDMIISNIWEACEKASILYKPQIFEGCITEFVPKKHYANMQGPELGWGNLAAGGLETYVLPVYPRGMLIEPFVRILAERLKNSIRQAMAKQEDKAVTRV